MPVSAVSSGSAPLSALDLLAQHLALPPLPTPGRRLDLPAGAGSADALWLAACAARVPAMLTVICADPANASRLRDEIAWFAPELRLYRLPDWETLPYDHFSPHHDLVSERLATLHAVMQGNCDVLLLPASTALNRLAPANWLGGRTFFLQQGERLNSEALKQQMSGAGYSHVTQVVSPGEYSIRGGLIDLFPMGAAQPYRIDLFDDEIDSIKTFDVDSQRSLESCAALRLLPAHEFPSDDAGRALFRQNFRTAFEGDPAKAGVYRDVSNGILPAGIEYWLPLFFETTASLFDYLPAASSICLHGDVHGAIRSFGADCAARYRLLGDERSRPLLPPRALFLDEEEFFRALQQHPRLDLGQSGASGTPGTPSGGAAPLPDVAINRRAERPLQALQDFLAGFAGRALIVADSAGRRETINDLLHGHGIAAATCADLPAFLAGDCRLGIALAPLQAGFVLAGAGAPPLAVISENELFAASPTPRRQKSARRQAQAEYWLRDLAELAVGDPVVHEQHGIGRYQGLVHMDLGEGSAEFLELHYANDARLYVPVAQLHVVARYAGKEADAAPLHALGSPQWEKAKRRAAGQARDTAAELLALYASRAARQGHAFTFSDNDYAAFAEGFGFEETPDQAAAIGAVITDMTAGRPMDRLVCGDVGFGKTEVALRAAFCAVAGGRQVAVLCPTTLLCEQHFNTFSDRFADWPVKIVELSRFRSAKESAAAIEGVAAGSVDIVIGTHKLLSAGVNFPRLGLVIIDEEHRFGVRQKEKLKSLRAEVDVLTLTATPIPRTLAMSLEGLRDFSVIATAPEKRLAIKTFVSRISDGIIREAVLRELNRGGQIYFLHNEVATIENMRDRLTALLPEARIVVGHGQMNERELEKVMRDFTQKRANLLLCTTIIETGIDNPHANTIIINRAEKFGLAQLHQLRGRVGRSHHQAYAYLLTNEGMGEKSGLTRQARQRLEAIQHMEDLGAGFYLAMHDLEIRGAGEVLGENQSGEMQEVGFNMFSDMLNRAVSALKQGKEPDLLAPLQAAAEINLHTPALLPNAYAPDVRERLILYKRLAGSASPEEIDALKEELVDRFGALPPAAEALIATHRVRLLVQPYCVARLDAGSEQIVVTFGPEFAEQAPIDPLRIIELIQQNRSYRLAGQEKIIYTRLAPTLNDKLAAIRQLFGELAGGKGKAK